MGHTLQHCCNTVLYILRLSAFVSICLTVMRGLVDSCGCSYWLCDRLVYSSVTGYVMSPMHIFLCFILLFLVHWLISRSWWWPEHEDRICEKIPSGYQGKNIFFQSQTVRCVLLNRQVLIVISFFRSLTCASTFCRRLFLYDAPSDGESGQMDRECMKPV